MADNPIDGNAPAPAEPNAPTSASSAPASPVPPSGQVPAWFQQYSERMDERLSQLDRTFKTAQGQARHTENEFRTQLARLNQYKTQGLSDDEALAEMEADDRDEQRWTSLEQKLNDLAARMERGGTQTNAQQSVAKVFEAVGLNLQDPRVASALVKQYDSADAVELAAYRLQREIAQSPNPTAAQQASLSGGQSAGTTNLDALSAEYEQLSANPSRNYERMTQIQKEINAAVK